MRRLQPGPQMEETEAPAALRDVVPGGWEDGGAELQEGKGDFDFD